MSIKIAWYSINIKKKIITLPVALFIILQFLIKIKKNFTFNILKNQNWKVGTLFKNYCKA